MVVGCLCAFVLSAFAPVSQSEEIEKEFEKKWRWNGTGRLWTDTELGFWSQRLRFLDWDATTECQNHRNAMVSLYNGGHDLGWASPRGNRGGTHFWRGQEDWIIISPKGFGGRQNDDVVRSMVHEAAHHFAGPQAGHSQDWQEIVDCVLSYSGA